MADPATIPAPAVTAEFLVAGEILSRGQTVTCEARSAFHARYTVCANSDEGETPDRVIFRIRTTAQEAWYLDSSRALVSLRGEVRPPWPAGCFVVVRLADAFFQIRFTPNAHFRLRFSDDEVTATCVVRDRRACALRLWGEHKLPPSSGRHTLDIAVSRLQTPDEAVWVEPFPRSARSVICLTDHPDWDSVPKIAALGELFERNQIRITKGVFPVSDPGWTKYGPGLNVPEYAALIDRWHAAGHEIACHGIGSAGDLSHLPLEECLARLDRLSPYRPETWIDHGGRYGFAQSARLPGDADLLEVLTNRGIRNLWSYGDAWQNPADELNIWSRRSIAGSVADSVRLARRRWPMRPAQLAYLATIPLKNLGGLAQYLKVLRRPWSIAEWRTFARNYAILRQVNTDPLFLYDLEGNFFLQDPDGLCVFDTIVMNHLALQLCPSAIDRLAAVSGILIAHVYMGAVHPHGGRNCFHVGRESEILHGFRENLEYIARLQQRGDVVTMPLRDLRSALVHHARSRVVRCEDGWDVCCETVVCSRSPWQLDGQAMTRDTRGAFSATVRGAARLSRPGC